MFNILRMDMRRMLRSKTFYVCLIILGVTLIFTQMLLWVVSDPQMVEYLNSKGILVSVSNPTGLDNLSLLDVFHQANIGGGLFAVVTGILSAIFVCSDFESGYVKNILSAYVNRGKYLWSKFLCISIVNLIFLLATFVIALVVNVLSGSPFHLNGASDILFYLLQIWALECGFTAMILSEGMLTRSKAAVITFAIFVCGGVVGMVLKSILGIFSLNKIMEYSLYMNVANAQTAYQGISSLKPFGVGIIFILVFMLLGQVTLSKRDV